jgi:hypothetical protein
MKVKISTVNWVCGEVLSADRIEIRPDTLVVEGDGTDIFIPYSPGNLEIQIWASTQQGVILDLEGRYSLQIPSGLGITSFHDGNLEVKAHKAALRVRIWRYGSVSVREAE